MEKGTAAVDLRQYKLSHGEDDGELLGRIRFFKNNLHLGVLHRTMGGEEKEKEKKKRERREFSLVPWLVKWRV